MHDLDLLLVSNRRGGVGGSLLVHPISVSSAGRGVLVMG
jgi:hypothetical protein